MKSRLMLLLVPLFANCYTSYSTPGGSLYQNATMNRDVPQATTVGGRTGESCVSAFFSLISSGDASIKAAAAMGGITTVKTVDYRVESMLGSMYVKTCTIANGD